MTDIVIDLLRHGQPDGGRRYRGHGVDDPLSAKGWGQMLAATDGDAPWQRIVSSPMQRCLPFAEHLGKRLNIPVRADDRFKEVGFGDWEGKTGIDLREQNADTLRNFYADPVEYRPAGAEQLADFVARVGDGLEEILQADAGTTLVVCHAGVIRAALGHILQQPLALLYRFNIANATLTRLRQTDERPPTFDFVGKQRL